MKIYKSEINDNLKDSIEKNQSIAFECPIVSSDVAQNLKLNEKSLATLLEENRQKDLYYLNSVLVSAGWNKNDDVFTSADLWQARNTPINKQFNYMHDETDIIGHMTNAIVVDENGNVIDSDENLPDKLDIITSAVIYMAWSDLTLKERITELTQKIDNGELSVSMECLFHGFDYALIAPDGSQTALARNESSAFLTKHLKAYGGTGEYEGYKVGRLLKSFYFTGKGLVDKPANPRSIIFSKDVSPFNAKSEITYNFLTATEVPMADVSQEDFLAIKAENLTLKSDLEKHETAIATAQAAISEKEQTLAANEVRIKELEDALATMAKEKEEMEKEKLSIQEKMMKMKKEAKNAKRKAALIEAGASAEKTEELITKFSEASDELFETVVALIVPNKPQEVETPDEVEADEAEDVDTDLDEADTSEASVVEKEPEDDAFAKAMLASSSFIKANILKSTKNLK